MIKKLKVIFLLMVIIGVINVSASLDNLGTFEQRQCIEILQTCTNCTYVNITSILSPDSTKALSVETQMSQNGIEYTIDFCNTTQIGKYEIVGFGDIDGESTNFIYDFEITPTGAKVNLGFYILILGISAAIIVGGFLIKTAPIVILGSFGLYFVGLYILLNGIVGVRDLVTTWALGLIILGLAAYISIRSAYELIEDY